MSAQGEYRMLIGGELVAAAETFGVINPATGEEIARVPDASEADLDAAVAAARAAFPGWAATPIADRKAKVVQFAGAIMGHLEELKRLLTSEQGKPHDNAEFEVGGAAWWLQGTAELDLPEQVNEDHEERISITRRVPIGVVGAIAPWNFPLILGMFKLAPALVAGNSVVLKPSPFTPLATLRIAELAKDIFPAGVLNVITGSDRLGPWMTAHPGFDKVSFTGSTATGRRVMASAAPTLKRLTLELGGNDAAIVLPDVDVEKIAPQLFWAAFLNAGQICIATKRLYIHKDIYPALRDAIFAYAKTVKLGDGAEQGTQIGPVNNKPQFDRVNDLIADSKAQGYTVLTASEQIDGPGYFIPVTLIDNPPEDARIVQEEQFGPVLPLLSFDTVEEAIARANASDYGLGGSVWSADEDKAYAIAQRIESGTVWVNEVQHLAPNAAFGGWKQSGVGVEGGVDGLLEFTKTQTLTRKRNAQVA